MSMPTDLSSELAERVAEKIGLSAEALLSRNPYDLIGACTVLSCADPLAAASHFAFQFSDIENPRRADRAIRDLFDSGIVRAEHTRLYGFWSRLPDTVTAYRGVDARWDGDPRGLCWTLSRAWADFYADRWGAGPGRVVRAEIQRELIVMAHNDRCESELVVPWWRKLKAVEIPARPRRELVMLHQQERLKALKKEFFPGVGSTRSVVNP